MAKFALTTKDNPYSPFTDFKKWYMYDVLESTPIKELGFTRGCSEQLALKAYTSDQFSDEENDEIISFAIDEIISNDIFDVYVKLINPVNQEDPGEVILTPHLESRSS